mmetsp:Transcript_27203/g.66175  ORF Transcript_27203/g.66175 Transcript_27203/m.66175 type:complete len:1328 (-) Transcript_27203:223-4206(-)
MADEDWGNFDDFESGFDNETNTAPAPATGPGSNDVNEEDDWGNFDEPGPAADPAPAPSPAAVKPAEPQPEQNGGNEGGGDDAGENNWGEFDGVEDNTGEGGDGANVRSEQEQKKELPDSKTTGIEDNDAGEWGDFGDAETGSKDVEVATNHDQNHSNDGEEAAESATKIDNAGGDDNWGFHVGDGVGDRNQPTGEKTKDQADKSAEQVPEPSNAPNLAEIQGTDDGKGNREEDREEWEFGDDNDGKEASGESVNDSAKPEGDRLQGNPERAGSGDDNGAAAGDSEPAQPAATAEKVVPTPQGDEGADQEDWGFDGGNNNELGNGQNEAGWDRFDAEETSSAQQVSTPIGATVNQTPEPNAPDNSGSLKDAGEGNTEDRDDGDEQESDSKIIQASQGQIELSNVDGDPATSLDGKNEASALNKTELQSAEPSGQDSSVERTLVETNDQAPQSEATVEEKTRKDSEHGGDIAPKDEEGNERESGMQIPETPQDLGFGDHEDHFADILSGSGLGDAAPITSPIPDKVDVTESKPEIQDSTPPDGGEAQTGESDVKLAAAEQEPTKGTVGEENEEQKLGETPEPQGDTETAAVGDDFVHIDPSSLESEAEEKPSQVEAELVAATNGSEQKSESLEVAPGTDATVGPEEAVPENPEASQSNHSQQVASEAIEEDDPDEGGFDFEPSPDPNSQDLDNVPKVVLESKNVDGEGNLPPSPATIHDGLGKEPNEPIQKPERKANSESVEDAEGKGQIVDFTKDTNEEVEAQVDVENVIPDGGIGTSEELETVEKKGTDIAVESTVDTIIEAVEHSNGEAFEEEEESLEGHSEKVEPTEESSSGATEGTEKKLADDSPGPTTKSIQDTTVATTEDGWGFDEEEKGVEQSNGEAFGQETGSQEGVSENVEPTEESSSGAAEGTEKKEADDSAEPTTKSTQDATVATTEEDWGFDEGEGEAKVVEPVGQSNIISQDDEWGNFDGAPSGEADVPDKPAVTEAAKEPAADEWGFGGEEGNGAGESNANNANPNAAGEDDWGSFGDDAAVSENTENVPSASAAKTEEQWGDFPEDGNTTKDLDSPQVGESGEVGAVTSATKGATTEDGDWGEDFGDFKSAEAEASVLESVEQAPSSVTKSPISSGTSNAMRIWRLPAEEQMQAVEKIIVSCLPEDENQGSEAPSPEMLERAVEALSTSRLAKVFLSNENRNSAWKPTRGQWHGSASQAKLQAMIKTPIPPEPKPKFMAFKIPEPKTRSQRTRVESKDANEVNLLGIDIGSGTGQVPESSNSAVLPTALGDFGGGTSRSKFDAIRGEIQNMLLGLPDLKFMLSRRNSDSQTVR